MTRSSLDRASLSPPRNLNAFAGGSTPNSAIEGIAKRLYPASSGDAAGAGKSPEISGAQAGTGPALSCSLEGRRQRDRAGEIERCKNREGHIPGKRRFGFGGNLACAKQTTLQVKGDSGGQVAEVCHRACVQRKFAGAI